MKRKVRCRWCRKAHTADVQGEYVILDSNICPAVQRYTIVALEFRKVVWNNEPVYKLVGDA
jgi:hypothetical protein